MRVMQRACIGTLITIGDEILLGDIDNGNAHFIALNLRQKGFLLNSIITVGDGVEEIAEVLNYSLQKSNYIIVTGGLGPTEDDRTIAAVSKAFCLSIVPNDQYRRLLKKHAVERGMKWSKELDKLTELPEGSTKIGVGMAGFALDYRNIPCYFLPGVPHEMRQLLDGVVIPSLQRRFPNRHVYRKLILRVQGLPESIIGDRLAGFSFQDLGIDVGYLPQRCENWVTLLATAENETDAKERLELAANRVTFLLGAGCVSGHDEESLELVIGRLLRERDWKIAVAESCTGGLLSARITSVPGASDYLERSFITYSNQAKMEMLAISEQLLAKYGAVSERVARAMAEGARDKSKADISLAITGIAGPSGGSPEKPVGTVFVACSSSQHDRVEKHFFHGTREAIQAHSAHAALVLLWRLLSK